MRQGKGEDNCDRGEGKEVDAAGEGEGVDAAEERVRGGCGRGKGRITATGERGRR